MNDTTITFDKLTISQEDFIRLVQFVQKNYGINLIQKKHLIESRLASTIKGKGFTSFSQYVSYILNTNNPKDLEVLLNKLTTNHTFFMRENSHFDFFRDTILPHIEKTKMSRKFLSIWSAGCSSGQEPYTLSMILCDYFKNKPGWDTRVLATDISMNVLNKAKEGIYLKEDTKELPQSWQRTYLVSVNEEQCTFVPKIKNNVIFKEFNLMDPIQFKIPFDVIFCRNVMIYFDQPTKDALIQRFYKATNAGGYLLIGHSETLNKENCPYQYLMPATYQKKQTTSTVKKPGIFNSY
ncbi:protein-glutamate O-methyltransferase CheR [Sinanaerobacter sp. ZZT-01]|uniref:CheR family methyltransferase n=1 Tax=Sinanaerobacter sp. ZZT-01 TaxID=3111540 RepID=UPI002D7A05DD|nr:protein-glutamate O-methyltransferase CheR [Sinanaerobacter sp. ZZT-01]WRR93579.1 protein-glutamate O-methyltransferase CheR [Sinanaerobacter sp. ZZT-01]